MNYDVGLIGCGSIAGTWIRAVGEHETCTITRVFDLDPEAAGQRAEEAKAEVAQSLEGLLSDVDLVVIGTPTRSHADLVVAAAEAGKHVLCEKPMALNLADCRRMIDACEAAGVELVIGHSLRFWDAFRRVRQLVAKGVIGTPATGSIDRMGTSKVLRASEQSGNGHWRDSVTNTGGHVLEGFVHELDFTRAVFGDVASVTCEVSGDQEYDGLLSPQVVYGFVRFESGAVVTTRTGSTVGIPSRGYWIAGTTGGLRFDNWGGPVQVYRPDCEVEELECEPKYAYTLELADLVDAIEDGSAPENSGLNGLKNVGLGLAMYHSHETGRRVVFTEGIAELPDNYENNQL